MARLVWIQGFKRSPINFRKFFLVPKEHNAKGIALFLTGYCNIYQAIVNLGKRDLGKSPKSLKRLTIWQTCLSQCSQKDIQVLVGDIILTGRHEGYFYFPKNTPTVVATSFAVTALFKAYDITGNEKYKETGISAGEFILKDLQRTTKSKGFLFSYSPLEGNNTVYNASLLGSKTLALCYYYSGIEKYKDAAKSSI